MAIQLVVFDMAGTTVSDKNYVGLAFQQAMKLHGFEVPIEEVNPIMGYEKPLAIKMMLEKKVDDSALITSDLITNIHKEFVLKMIQFYTESPDIKPLPDVDNTFLILKNAGIKIALNTGFSRDIASVIVKRLGWENKIDLLVASDEVPKGRPFPDMIQKIMKELNVSTAESIAKVGDTEVDVNEGINAGCKYVIAVTTGAFTREELLPYNPTHIVDNVAEILNIIGVSSLKTTL